MFVAADIYYHHLGFDEDWRWVLTVRRRSSATTLPAEWAQISETSGMEKSSHQTFIGNSPLLSREIAKLAMIARCDAGVLILGETGTGKEVMAQSIHYLSARASKPWVAVNCGAFPTELVENELFGHVKGAYTTAHSARAGLVREAEGGTLFLDDVDCLPLPAQAKLLRFLQEHEYRVVGANATQHANVRVIAASNRNLAALASQGAFRSDLYFRLNVVNLKLPALRERREDIAALASHFMGQFAQRYKRAINTMTPSALAKLQAHDWPGNVRELQHVIERAVVLAPGPALTDQDLDLDLDLSAVGKQAPCDESFCQAKARVVEQFERSYLEQMLFTNEGNVTHAARAAKKNRRAFFALMRKHDISPDRFRHSG
jgi:two-component system response regulator GlrR